MKTATFFFLATLLFLYSCQSDEEKEMIEDPSPEPIAVRGTWVNQITVPPDPTVTNEITFDGEATHGTFLDQFGHSGNWTLEGDSITWIYIGVSELDNTFAGKVDKEGVQMSGRNFGVWQGREFEGTWEATKK